LCCRISAAIVNQPKEEAILATKIDYKKELKEFYLPSAKQPSIVEVPTMSFLMINGRGNPNDSQEFEDAVTALYGLSYTLKFMLKGKGAPDYTVMPLEGLWWNPAKRKFDPRKDMWDWDEWKWTLMIAQPVHINAENVKAASAELKRKKNPPALAKSRFREFDEGLSVQIMHIGPYADEEPTITRLHLFAVDNGYKLRGKHHEIYISDPRRAKPQSMKTVVRHPVSLK
jgi:hypothetical protein